MRSAPSIDWARMRTALSSHRAEIAVAAITIVGAAIRFATLGQQSLNHDETVTAARVLHPDFFQSMQVVFNGERSPPLYYALVWLWTRAFGVGAVALRFPSAIAGTAVIPLAYMAARELGSRRAGVIAAALVALNPYLVWYSQEARSYCLLVALGALGFWLFARALRQPSRWVVIGWAVASALALCTHYFAAFAIVPEAAILLLRHGLRRRLVVAVVAVGLVGSALIPLALVQEGSGRGNGFRSFPVLQRAEAAVVKFTGSEGPAPQGGISSTSTLQREVGLAGAIGFAFAIALGLARGRGRERFGLGRALAVAGVAFCLPVLMAVAGVDFVDPRNLIGAVVPALVAAAIGLAAARSLGTVAAVAAVALFAFVNHAVDTTPSLQRHDWRAGVAAADPRRGPSLYVVPRDGRSPVEYYAHRRLPKFAGSRFRGGVATRRIVVISDAPLIHAPAAGFRRASTRIAPQHWTVETYLSRRPRSVEPKELSRSHVMPLEPWTTLVSAPQRMRALEASVDSHSRPEARHDIREGQRA
jgi:mannosyltransferase